MRHDLTVWHTGGCDGHDVEPVTSTVRTPHIMLREIKSIAENILLEDCLCAAAPEGRPRQGHDYHPCAEVPRVLKSAPEPRKSCTNQARLETNPHRRALP